MRALRRQSSNQIKRFCGFFTDMIVDLSDPEDNHLLDASANGLISAVEILLDSGAEVNAKNRSRKTALHLASKNGSTLIAQLLIKHGANISEKDDNGSTSLHVAAENGYLEIVVLLIREGANVTDQNLKGQSALHLAAKGGKRDVIKALISESTHIINSTDNKRLTATHYAVHHRQWETVIDLIEYGADINIPDVIGNTVLKLVKKVGTEKYFLHLNEIYEAISSNCVTTLRKILSKRFYDESGVWRRKHDVDHWLSQAYERIKITNVPLTTELELFVNFKLLDLRANNCAKNEIPFESISAQKNRVIQMATILENDYKENTEVDGTWFLTAKLLVQEIQILKRRLRPTYDKLPWEEIEFCICIFVGTHTKPENFDCIYKMVLNQKRVLNHILSFRNALNEENVEDLGDEGPKINDKFKIREIILKRYNIFIDLYEDYKIIRTICSLTLIEDSITAAISVYDDKIVQNLAIERALQIIGENIKNTLESPKMPVDLAKLIKSTTVSDVQRTFAKLRNSLSHINALKIKMGVEASESMFTDIKNDLLKLLPAIQEVLYELKSNVLSTFVAKVKNCELINEARDLIYNFHPFTKIEDEKSDFGLTTEQATAVKLVNKYSDGNDVFNEIIENIDEYGKRLSKTRDIYLRERELVFGIIKLLQCADNGILPARRAATSYTELQSKGINVAIEDSVVFCAFRKVDKAADPALYNQIVDCMHEVLPVLMSSRRIDTVEDFSKKMQKKARGFAVEATDKIIGTLKEKLDSKIGTEFMKLIKIPKTLNNLRKSVGDFLDDQKLFKFREKLKLEIMNLKLDSNGINEICEIIDNTMFNPLYDERLDLLKNLIGNKDPMDLLNLYSENKGFRLSVEMLILELVELEEVTFGREDIPMFQYSYYPTLIGRTLRNCLAHGDISVEILPVHMPAVIIFNLLKLIEGRMNDFNVWDVIDSKVERTHYIRKEDRFEIKRSWSQNQHEFYNSIRTKNLRQIKKIQSKLCIDLKSRDKIGRSCLHIAAETDSPPIFRYFYSKGLNPISKDINGLSVLEAAVVSDSSQLVEFFIPKIRVKTHNEYGNTLLHLSALFGSEKVTKALLSIRGVNVFDVDQNLRRPLHIAAEYGHIAVVRLFLARQDISETFYSMFFETPLCLAAKNGYLSIIEFIKTVLDDEEWREMIRAKTLDHLTCLHMAVKFGDLELIEFLVENGADIEAYAKDGYRPLHVAAFFGHLRIVEYLVQKHVELDARTKESFTALHVAAMNNRQDVADFLIKNGQSTNFKSSDGTTPLHLAIAHDCAETVQVLLNNSPDIEAMTCDNLTPLLIAVLLDHYTYADLLLKRKAKYDESIKPYGTPLELALKMGHSSIVTLFVANGADFETHNCTKYLHLAIGNGHKEIVEFLINCGADVSANVKNDFNCMHLVAIVGYVEIADILFKKGLDVNSATAAGLSPLHFASLHGHLSLIKWLIDKRAIVNARAVNQMTPLHLAAEYGHLLVCQYLVERNAEVDAVTEKGMTPMDFAAKNQHSDIVNYFNVQKRKL